MLHREQRHALLTRERGERRERDVERGVAEAEPGIDAQHVQSKMAPADWNKLFTDISPADLSSKGRPFPLSQYFTDIVEGYERVVLK